MRIERKNEFRPTVVHEKATIGANATIVCGNEIGRYELIGAGAVVATDVPDHPLTVGVPAQRIGGVSHSCERLGEDFICPAAGRRNRETERGGLEEIVE